MKGSTQDLLFWMSFPALFVLMLFWFKCSGKEVPSLMTLEARIERLESCHAECLGEEPDDGRK